MYIYIHTYINNIFIMYTYTPPPHPTPQGGAGRHTYIKTCGHTDICTDTHDHDHLGGGGGGGCQACAIYINNMLFGKVCRLIFHYDPVSRVSPFMETSVCMYTDV